MTRRRWTLGLFLLVGAACRHGPDAPPMPVCVPPAGSGTLCLFRNQFGALQEVSVVVDQQNVGLMGNNQFVQIDLPPGPHHVEASLRLGTPSLMDINTAEGMVTYLRITLDPVQTTTTNTVTGMPVATTVLVATLRPQTGDAALQQIHDDCEPGLHIVAGQPVAQPAGAPLPVKGGTTEL